MKKLQTNNYVVVGTAHMGINPDILRVVGQIVKLYNATPVHCGAIATSDEIAMHRRRLEKLRTWQKISKERAIKKADDIAAKNSELEGKASVKIDNPSIQSLRAVVKNKKVIKKNLEKIDNIDAQMAEQEELILAEIKELEDAQQERINLLEKVLGKNLLLVCNSENMIATSRETLGHLDLGGFLEVSSMPANNDKVSGAPITMRTHHALRIRGKSQIVAHTIPHARSLTQHGLNNALNLISTGSLLFPSNLPMRISEAYSSLMLPSCVLVSVNADTGEFHHQRIRIYQVGNDVFALHDGQIITAKGVKESDEADKAVHTTDEHTPHEHMGCVAATVSLIDLHKPYAYISGGDTADFESVSRHTADKPGSRENLRLKDDLNSMVRYLETVSRTGVTHKPTERTMLDSNHADWLTQFIDINPSLKGLLDWATVAVTYLRGWDVYLRTAGADKGYKFADLMIKHGDKEQTVATAGNIYRNYLGGHHHSYQELGDALFVGPLCKLGPKYLQNSATSWQNQITTLTKYKGIGSKHPRIVLHNDSKQTSTFSYRGQIYEVPFFKY